MMLGLGAIHRGSGPCPEEELRSELFGLRVTAPEHQRGCPEEEEERDGLLGLGVTAPGLQTQITKIQNEQGNITTDMNEIQNIIRSYFENLYSNKIENLEDINRFLETYELPKVNQEDIHNLNRSISSNEIEEVIKSLPTKKSPGPDGFSAKFYKTFKEELIPILLTVFHEIEEGGTLPNSFYETNITLIPKLHRDTETHRRKKMDPPFDRVYIQRIEN
ncbi:LINE-1 retrotransposable element ORF2 protein [Sciurus carolinensis]|uniref:LINE-1 retrotransposable element ORF2 protein n=1 Tax=Sciurus carolinensis TaxID=30640 RepID=A0AA41T0P4_SCICA|nr:LINE-1 retrotransposable element ORF2 protein [Sciurus carolinensis]